MADSGAPIRGKNGQVHGAVMVFRDVTEGKRAEAALIHAKEAAEAADRTKSEFLATMSHELRTPLNVILGYTDILLDGGAGSLSDAQRDLLRRIDRNARVLFELISMVLDLNRLEAGRLPVEATAVEVADLLGEIRAETQGLCDQSGLACVWDVAEPAILIMKIAFLGALRKTTGRLVTNERTPDEQSVSLRGFSPCVAGRNRDVSRYPEREKQTLHRAGCSLGRFCRVLHPEPLVFGLSA